MLCWNKLQQWENFSQWEMAWTSFDKPAAMFTKSNTGGANKETKIHPTQKPVELYKWILKKYAKIGDLILDTNRGSGSLDIACHDLKFDLVTCEKEKKYFDSGNLRLDMYRSQLQIF